MRYIYCFPQIMLLDIVAGVGGFGEIYLCSNDTSRSVGDDATHVMKIEPHENGPLFVEKNFYIRAAKRSHGM